MKHNRITGLMTAALAALFVSASIKDARLGVTSTSTRSTAGGAPKGNRSGKRYPEQSMRQKLRGMRRAQGGPGLAEGNDPLTLSEAA